MKNKILWTITNINAVSFLLMVIMLDSDSWIPFIIMCINALWLMPFILINLDYFSGAKDDRKTV